MFISPKTETRNLRDLPAAALKPLAVWFTAVGDMLHAAADRDAALSTRRDDAAARVAARRQIIQGVPALLATYLLNGMDDRAAVSAVMKATGLDEAVVTAYVGRARKMKAGSERDARNRLIMKARADGLSNAEIGARFNLHPISVARIIGRELSAANGGGAG